jgi:hypothetical protein
MEIFGKIKEQTCVGSKIVKFPGHWIQVWIEVFVVEKLLDIFLF